MALNTAERAAITSELNEALRGAIVQNVYAPWERRAYLEVRVPGKSALLCLTAEPPQARLSVALARPMSPPRASAFQQRLRALLVGARVTEFSEAGSTGVAVALTQADQAFWFIVDWRDGGPHLALLDASSRVLAASPAAAQKLAHQPPSTLRSHEPRPDAGPLAAVPVAGVAPRFAPLVGAAFPWAEAAERHLEQAGAKERVEEVRRAALQSLKSRRVKLARTLEKVEAEAARGAIAEEHQRIGELLAQNLHRLGRGHASLRLVEYTASGPVEVDVKVDPKRTPKEEVAWRFHQAKRLRRGAQIATERLTALRAQLAALEHERSLLERPGGLPPSPSRPPDDQAPPRPSAGRAKGPQTAAGYREFIGWGGARLFVGKHGRGNDELTFRVARPHDLWVHVRGQPGSHVIVRLERGAQLPQEVLLDAAHLAVHYSPAKDEERVEVQYAAVRHLRKAKGGTPGQVIVTQEKTFVVRHEAERLRRLLHTSETQM